MESEIWIKRYPSPELHKPVAVVGSPGLRSIGILAMDSLIAQTKARLSAELYSVHLPSIYQTTPSYAAHPSLPGEGGAIVDAGTIDFPKIQFFACPNPSLIFVRGYHANFKGQYNVAKEVVNLLSEMNLKRMIVVAGFGSKEKNICCAANSQEALDNMKKIGVGIGYKGPFMGFSGLVFGLSKLKDIEAICIFAGTEPKEDDLMFPDREASDRVVELISQMLGLGK